MDFGARVDVHQVPRLVNGAWDDLNQPEAAVIRCTPIGEWCRPTEDRGSLSTGRTDVLPEFVVT